MLKARPAPIPARPAAMPTNPSTGCLATAASTKEMTVSSGTAITPLPGRGVAPWFCAGTWGVSLWADDTACDVHAMYCEAPEGGAGDEAATETVRAHFASGLADEWIAPTVCWHCR